MCSNIYLKNENRGENISLNSKKKVNLFFVAHDNKNLSKTLNINLKDDNIVNIYCLILSDRNDKILNININHYGNRSVSNIFVQCLANNNAKINVNCVSTCHNKTNKNTINQTIDGLIFDNESLIQALPCLDINTNDIIAKHTVNIGQIDPEIIFYLNTKGLSKLESYQFLINNFLNKVKPYIEHNKININKSIKKIIGGQYE